MSNQTHTEDCGYTVTGRDCNCDCAAGEQAPTPETDGTMKYCFGDDREFVPADFARRLERERDEALRVSKIRMMNCWAIEAEREEARAEVARLTYRLQTVADESEIGGPQECQSAEDNITRIEGIITDALKEITFQRAEVARLTNEVAHWKAVANYHRATFLPAALAAVGGGGKEGE